ncbi:MFS transporter [Curtobacterium sp. MCJR17_043]|nr:MFS transporter [Curtobacterium sp. MCJR17_043]WIB37097.1 MFS transporter [Curtobacterium sp. MCJR17_043]
MGRDLDASTSDASWVLTAYLLSASVLTPILGRLGDMVGKRKVLIVVLTILLVGAVLAALAPNLGVLIVARALQGAAGAVMPLSIGIVRDELPKEKVSVTIGLLSAIFGIGAGVGIVAAGPIVEHLSWHWLFWLPAVLVVIALLGTVFGMPESPVRKPGRLDVVGTAVLAVSLVAVLLAVSEGQTWGWGDGKTVGLLVLGAVALVAFVLVELRVAEPLIDVRLFAVRGVWTAHVVALVFGFAMFGTFVLVPTLLQLPAATGYGFGKDVTEAGLFLLPTVVMMVIAGPVAGILVRKVGPKPPDADRRGRDRRRVRHPRGRARRALAGRRVRPAHRRRHRHGTGRLFERHHRERPREPDRRGDQRQHGRPDDRVERRHRGHRSAHHLAQHAAGPADRRRVHHRLLGVHRCRGPRGGRRARGAVDARPSGSGRGRRCDRLRRRHALTQRPGHTVRREARTGWADPLTRSGPPVRQARRPVGCRQARWWSRLKTAASRATRASRIRTPTGGAAGTVRTGAVKARSCRLLRFEPSQFANR